MADLERRTRGLERIEQIYGGDVRPPPAGASAFMDLMVEHLFGEVWTRPQLCDRDRRLLMLGAIVALGEKEIFDLQARSALRNGELTPEQLREVLVHLVYYAGYPRVAPLVARAEKLIAEQLPQTRNARGTHP